VKWFKHETSDRNKIESKLIKAKFGAEGYGIWQALLEVVAENIERDNAREWGYVDVKYDVNALANEVNAEVDALHAFLKFTDEKGITKKHRGRLFIPLILRRLDEYTERCLEGINLSGLTRDSIGTHSGRIRTRIRRDIEETASFKKFWDNYPKKKDKGSALRAWNKLNPNDDLQAKIFNAIEAARETEDWQKQGGQFIPYPATYLNGRRWEDEVSAPKVAPVIKELPPPPQYSEAQRQKNLEALAEVRDKILNKK